jgi:predicted RNase H-like HicB family nuclease
MIEMTILNEPRTLQDYLELEYPINVFADPDIGGYVIEYPDLPGCMTEVEVLSELPEMAEEARRLWLTTAFNQGLDIPLPSYPETYSGKFNVRLPKSLHRKLVESAEREGVSLNQHVVSLLSEAVTLCAIERRLTALEASLGAPTTDSDDDPVDDEPVDPKTAFFENPRSILSNPR